MSAVLQPSADEILRLTQSAAQEVQSMLAAEAGNEGKVLRVYVETGGCSGLQYGMVFDERRDEDHILEFFGVPVVVDKASADYLRGTVVDFSDAMTGGGFKISNPRAKSSCGCGKSFEA